MFLGTAVQASIQIINPVSLRDQVAPEGGFIDNGMANFGHIDYGISIVSVGLLKLTLILYCSWDKSLYP